MVRVKSLNTAVETIISGVLRWVRKPTRGREKICGWH